jgi:hypothetical protein
MFDIKLPVSGLIWTRLLGLPVITVEPNNRPSGWKARPVRPVFATGVPTKVPPPVAWLMVTNAPRFRAAFPLLPYMVTPGVQVGDPVAVAVAVAVFVGVNVGVADGDAHDAPVVPLILKT